MNARSIYVCMYICMYTNLRTWLVLFIYVCAYLFTLFQVSSMRRLCQGFALACSTMTLCIFRQLMALYYAIDAILNYE